MAEFKAINCKFINELWILLLFFYKSLIINATVKDKILNFRIFNWLSFKV